MYGKNIDTKIKSDSMNRMEIELENFATSENITQI